MHTNGWKYKKEKEEKKDKRRRNEIINEKYKEIRWVNSVDILQ